MVVLADTLSSKTHATFTLSPDCVNVIDAKFPCTVSAAAPVNTRADPLSETFASDVPTPFIVKLLYVAT